MILLRKAFWFGIVGGIVFGVLFLHQVYGVAGSDRADRASNATGCISVSNSTIKNSCNKPVGVDICHDDNGATDFIAQHEVCGSFGSYYANLLDLAPSENYRNSIMMPAGIHMHYAACFGTHLNITFDNKLTGQFHCL